MDEQLEDMLIAFYLTGEGEKGYDEARMKKLLEIMDLIKRVRGEIKKRGG